MPDDTPPPSSAASSTSSPQLADGEPHRLAEVAHEAGVTARSCCGTSSPSPSGSRRPAASSRGCRSFSTPTARLDRAQPLPPPDAAHPRRAVRARAGARDAPRRAAAGGAPAIDGARRAGCGRRSQAARGTTRATPRPPRPCAAAGRLEQLRACAKRTASAGRCGSATAKGGEETSSQRIICPYAIVFASGMWYAVAHCESSDGVRFFRLDRVEDVELLEARFTPAARVLGGGHRAGRDGVPGDGARHATGALLAEDRALDRGAGREDARRRTARS